MAIQENKGIDNQFVTTKGMFLVFDELIYFCLCKSLLKLLIVKF